jgi:gluconolactonase
MVRAAFCLLLLTFGAGAQEDGSKLEKMLANVGFPAALAWSKDGYLLVADTPAGHLRRIDSKGTTRLHQGVHAAGLAFDHDGKLWIGDSRARRLLHFDKKGKSEPAPEKFEGKAFNGPSDIAIARNGHVYFADPAWGRATESRELPFYGIFHIDRKGQTSAAVKLQSRPSGLALSLDGKTLFASLADGRSVMAWTVGREGELTDERVFAKDIDGVPDGLTTGADGRVYVAAREVLVYSPAGELVRTIHLPEKAVDCEFGEDGETLFIASEEAVYRWRARADAPTQKEARE